MKTKLFTLLALCLTLSTFTAKAINDNYLFYAGGNYAPNAYFGAAPSLCTWTSMTENGNTFARFVRPATASKTDGPQWGIVDFTSVPSQQTGPTGISGGNITMGTGVSSSYWRYATVRMRKNTSGVPQVIFSSQTQYNVITTSTPVVVGEWVSYLFEVANTSGTAYKMLTVIPDKDNVTSTTDIDDIYVTSSPIAIPATVNDVTMGTVSGGGTYPKTMNAILTATPKAGYRFVNWINTATSAQVATTPTYTYATASGAISLQANFAAGYTIAATSNDVAKGTVAGAGGFDGSAPISLTATVLAGNRFIGWAENGTLVSTDLVYTFTPAANRTLVANFGVASTNYTSPAPAALTYVYGTAGATGAKGSFAIDYLGTGDVTVSLPSTPSYEISLTDGSGYTDGPITLTANGSSNVPYTTIYVRLKDGLGYAASYANTATITPTTGTAGTISLTGSVSKKNLLLGNVTNVRRYNGTTTATGITGALAGIVGTDDVSLSGTGTFSAAAVGTFKSVTVNLSGTAAGNYTCTPIVGHIYAKWLNVGLVSPSSKVYDAAVTAALPTGTIGSLLTAEAYAAGTENDGKPYTTETVTLTSASVTAAAYTNLNVAYAYQITYTGPALAGTNAANYTLAYPSTITPKALTVTTANKVYDGTSTATTTLNGKLSADNATVSLNGSLAFANANVGTAKAVTIATPLTLSGTVVNIGTTNYSLTQPSGLTANITAKALTLTSAAAPSKPYDGTTAATITGTLTGVIVADNSNVTLVGTGTFADAAIATGVAVTSTATLTGSAATNYSLTQPTGLTADILASYHITAVSNTPSWGTVSGGGYYLPGAPVTLTAVKTSESNIFYGWISSGPDYVSTNPVFTFTASADVSYTAVFDNPTGINQSKIEASVTVIDRKLKLIGAANSVSVYDGLGHLIASLNGANSTIAINASGIYIVKITTAQGIKTQKVIVR
jgi:hypothetical protein